MRSIQIQEDGRLRIFRQIAIGRNLIKHELGLPPAFVTFFDGEEQVFLEWYRSDGGADCNLTDTIVIQSSQVYPNIEINLL